MDMDQIIQTFIVESKELLVQFEDDLLRLEHEPDDNELLNAIFRVAHTIKGSAGLFGFDAIVAFTHVTENLLDQLRNGAIAVNADLIALLLQAGDHIQALLETEVIQRKTPDQALLDSGQALQQGMADYLGKSKTAANSPVVNEFQVTETLPAPAVEGHWHISVRFDPDVLKFGLDPLPFIRYLATKGDIVYLSTVMDKLPDAMKMDPELCYLGFEIGFCGEVEKQDIENVFEFVQDDCTLRILPPDSKIADYIKLIEELSEDTEMLGEILISCGVITQKELDDSLQLQRTGAIESQQPIGAILVQHNSVQQPIVDAALAKQKTVKEQKLQETRFIRIDADKLDQLINLVGELVIAGASATLLAQHSQQPAMQETTSAISTLVEDIRDRALQLRMVPIGETFAKFNRVVRDVSKDLGKNILLDISGAETELDKTLIEKIGDPLLHLVRNAMDHGIENEEERLARGKPAQGRLKLNACHDSGSIVIEVSDDGGGLNRDRILAKATEKGLVSAGQVLTEQDIFNLIFEPGFSTAEQVTNLSGRGVGMDVVKRNILALRGTIDINSVLGQGTTIRIRLPLTLAIIDGFLVEVAASSFVIPLEVVVECVELPLADTQVSDGRSYVNLRGEILPYVNLRTQLNLTGKVSRRANIVVVQYAGQKAGLVVDALLGECQTVIKPLGNLFKNLSGISGSTILGSGEVALILDVSALITSAIQQESKNIPQLAQ